jgi:uncharacterized Zn ribbon protein
VKFASKSDARHFRVAGTERYSSTVFKRGTMMRGVHLTDNADEIEGRTDKVKGLVLRTEFLKKA